METELQYFPTIKEANQYAKDNGLLIHQFQLSAPGTSTGVVVLLVNREGGKPKIEPVQEQIDESIPVLQAVFKMADGSKKPTYVMSGVFGVPAGSKLSPDDTEIAPKPLLSPSFDIKEFSKWLMRPVPQAA